MVQIIPAAKQKYSFGSAVGQNFGEGLGEGMEDYFDRKREDKYRKEEDEALKRMGYDLAGVREPRLRAELLANQAQHMNKTKNAKNSLALEINPNRLTAQRLREKEELPEFLENRLSKYQSRDSSPVMDQMPRENLQSRQTEIEKRSPSNPYYGVEGSLNEASVEGQKRRIYDGDEIAQQGHMIAENSTRNGYPMTAEQGMQIAAVRNDQNRVFNQELDNQKLARIETERAYGNKAVEELRKYFPPDNPASPEMEALFTRYGEEAAKEGQSQSDVNKELAKKAKDFKDMISRAEKTIPPGRVWQKTKEKFSGKEMSEQQRINAVKLDIQPLLDLGLYDTARRILAEKGYGVEETESIVSNLPEGAKKNLSTFPTIKSTPRFDFQTSTIDRENYTPEQRESINSMVSKVFQDDPSTNLILLRKALDEKNVGWRTYKDALDQAMMTGNLKLNAEQSNQTKYLNEPPQGPLGTILEGLNIIGR